ncbi:hypothetical protein RRG08_015530 [Elysia crispata]|uniref:Uncharacterized protein n=1 Tax=Elysia crispata TaxID=231223 RepID=A0AAE1CZF3_9GAST|nr:hypothetical protein RRG08_015530 [Elysia crispata]
MRQFDRERQLVQQVKLWLDRFDPRPGQAQDERNQSSFHKAKLEQCAILSSQLAFQPSEVTRSCLGAETQTERQKAAGGGARGPGVFTSAGSDKQ